MVAVRTITVFFNTSLYPTNRSPERLRAFVSKINIERLKRPFEKAGIEVYNVRLSISPPRTKEELEGILKIIEEAPFDYFGGFGTFGVNGLTRTLPSVLRSDERVTAFISVESLEEAIKASDVVLELKNDVSAARLLVGVNPPRFSPYLPYSFIRDPAISYGLSIAINRVSDLRDAIENNSYEEVKRAVFVTLPKVAYPIHEIAQKLDVPYMGIDVSLAPMPGVKEESVGALLSDLSSSVDGMLSYIYTLNEAIKEYPLVAPLVGYNRVMTPLGEDHVLARLAEEGKLTVDTLKARSAVCSTGVDVVPILYYKVTGTIVDTIAIGLSQRKTIGARVIPRDKKESVDLGAIGKAPVLRRAFFFSSSGMNSLYFSRVFLLTSSSIVRRIESTIAYV